MSFFKSIKSAFGSDGDDYDVYGQPTTFVNPFSKDKNVAEHERDKDDEIKIDVAALHRDIVVTFDGQESFHLLPGDSVIVRRAPLPAKIVKFDDKNYYQTIRTKLLYNA